MLSVRDTIVIRGDLAEVYECFWNPRLWTEITPHVKKIEMLDETATSQRFKMEVHSDGKEYYMETQRQAFPLQAICYRQLRPPPFLTLHTGEWNFALSPEGVRVTLSHEVEVDADRACEILGVTDAEEAVRRIRTALKHNGSSTLHAVKRWVEEHIVA